MKIGVVFDNRRNDTTGNYVLKALARSDHEVYHISTSFWKYQKPELDTYLVIDDGINCEWPEKGQFPFIAYWVIDTHLDPGWRIKNAIESGVDHVFCAQKNGVEIFEKRGISASWLPLACDPEVHFYDDGIRQKYDICFVGHTDPFWRVMDRRIDFLEWIFSKFPNFFYGQRYLKDATEIYTQSKIVLNHSVNNDINMRCFEACCSGSLLLTDRIKNNGFEDLFIEDIHLIVYSDFEDAATKIRYFLEHDDKRETIANLGRKNVFQRHTYHERMQEILRVIDSFSGGNYVGRQYSLAV